MNEQSMAIWLLKRASLTPERLAVIADGKALTFRKLNEKAQRMAKSLLSVGVRPGDRVALLAPNGINTLTFIHALQFAGAILVPLNARLTGPELIWQLNDAEASLLVYDPRERRTAQTIVSRFPHLEVLVLDALASRAVQQVRGELQETVRMDAVHSIMYTSGTTGHPKGVMLTYGNYWWSAVGSALNLGLHTDDRWLMSVPLFHVSGLSIAMRSVIYGITTVVCESFDPEAVNDAITTEKVTIVSVVSTMLARMVEALGRETYPPTLRCVLLGGGPAPKQLLEESRERRIPVFQTYGLTETASQVATLSPEYMVSKKESAGKPLFPAELRIVKDEVVLSRGEVGEIAVKGPNVTKGYWKRDEVTKKAIRNGWFHTGDIGYLDEDGFLYVLDRRSDLIISGGENVYPAEIESVLLSHPDVVEAGVAGKVDERWGQVPVAFVKLVPGREVREEDLKQYCRKQLARYKIPVNIYQVSALPRNSAGKLIRRKLLDLI